MIKNPTKQGISVKIPFDSIFIATRSPSRLFNPFFVCVAIFLDKIVQVMGLKWRVSFFIESHNFWKTWLLLTFSIDFSIVIFTIQNNLKIKCRLNYAIIGKSFRFANLYLKTLNGKIYIAQIQFWTSRFLLLKSLA